MNWYGNLAEDRPHFDERSTVVRAASASVAVGLTVTTTEFFAANSSRTIIGRTPLQYVRSPKIFREPNFTDH